MINHILPVCDYSRSEIGLLYFTSGGNMLDTYHWASRESLLGHQLCSLTGPNFVTIKPFLGPCCWAT